ncbi:MAG: hypothetical protein MUF30_05590 [Burkholderiales bacterium]|jgi:hypothetical protein|nr:hypothetical protein [Burkholderiales bacterium]
MSAAREPRRVAAMRGLAWWIDGGRLFLRKPVTWIVYTVITWAVVAAANLHPLLVAAAALAMPILLAGWSGACEAAAAGRSTPVSMLFDGLRRGPARLAALGGVVLLGNIAILLVFRMALGELWALLGDPSAITAAQQEALQQRLPVAVTMALAVAVPLTAATWFAPLGVHLDAMRPGTALLMSLRAVIRNPLAFAVYSVVCLPIFAVPLGVAIASGMPVPIAAQITFWSVLPWLVPSTWCGWRDVMPAAADDRPGPGAA